MKRLISILLPFLIGLFTLSCSEDARFSTNENATNLGASTRSDQVNISELIEAEIANESSNPINGDDGSSVPLVEVIQRCNSANKLSREIPFFFPKPQVTCEWGKNGNLSERNGFFQARIEQVARLNLPSGAVLCDAEFEFEEQDFLYDDHFLLTLNNSVIASSYDFRDKFAMENGLLRYNWQRMAGMVWDHDDELIYCPRLPGASSSCRFPGHDQQGKIELNYDKLYIQSIMANGLMENHFFSMVSIGDNDNQDCEHSDVRFTVKVEYYVQ